MKNITIIRTQLDSQGREIMAPAADMCELDETYRVKCDMPGVNQDELLLEIGPDRIFIQGEARLEMPSGMKVRALEFGGIVYRLTIALPADVEEKEISAVYRDGVLLLILPKKKQSLGRRVTVNGGSDR